MAPSSCVPFLETSCFLLTRHCTVGWHQNFKALPPLLLPAFTLFSEGNPVARLRGETVESYPASVFSDFSLEKPYF